MEEFTVEMLATLFGDFSVNFNFLWISLFCGIILDFITGIAKAYKSEGGASSSKLRDGGFKKCGIIVVAIMSLGLSKIFNDTYNAITNSVLCYYVYTELVSIIENMEEMGVPLPPLLKKIIRKSEKE